VVNSSSRRETYKLDVPARRQGSYRLRLVLDSVSETNTYGRIYVLGPLTN